jgi:GrpB-like predicted nucleotidyltransferase (UPF0157 family)
MEKLKLHKILPNLNIKHIGSTAVKNLGGKGIIDILISVPVKKILKVKRKLIKAGYKFKPGDKKRLFFEKDYGLIKKRRVHLQLTSNNSAFWKDAIKFRDVLRNNKKIKEIYSLIKQKAVRLGKEGKEYRKFKEEFIRKVSK